MQARFVRVWFLAGLVALAAGAALGVATAARAALDARGHVVVLVVGLTFLALAVALGLLPAFLRRDWPTPLYAMGACVVAALGPVLWLATGELRALAAPLGVALAMGALHPLLLLAGPRWSAEPDTTPFRRTDLVARASLALGLAGALAGGALLVWLPRGAPHAALATLLLGACLPVAFGALLFLLPRSAREPLSAATLAWGALVAGVLAALALALAWLFPVASDFRAPAAGLGLAFALAGAALLRAKPPADARPLLASGLALAVLAGLATLLAMLFGKPSTLLPAALYAQMSLALAVLAGALVLGAPLLLPGALRGKRWMRWAPALAIAGLFLLAPAFQYARSPLPGALALAVALAIALRGLAPLGSSAPPRVRRKR